MNHPAACPHCGGTFVNAVCPDLQIRDARLDDNGTVVIGDMDTGTDWEYQDMLHCSTCASTFAIPLGVNVVYDESLKTEYSDDYSSPAKGDPAYIGADVYWAPVERNQLVISCGGVEWVDLLGPIVDRMWNCKLTLADKTNLEGELRRIDGDELVIGLWNDEAEDCDEADTRINCGDLVGLEIT